jgi:hypothetical protein
VIAITFLGFQGRVSLVDCYSSSNWQLKKTATITRDIGRTDTLQSVFLLEHFISLFFPGLPDVPLGLM